MEKILLSSFTVKISKDKNELVLSLFNGQDDFFKFCQNFFQEIFRTIQKNDDRSDSTIIHLSLDELPTINIEKRCIYGYLSSGVSGENYKIKNTETNEEVFKVTRNHAAFRDVFFYLQIPKNKTNGALILQRKSKFGVKTVFYKGINQFAKKIGFQGYHIQINNIVHGKVYQKMIKEGNLKKIEFIKHKIPSHIETYYANGGKVDSIPGILKTTISASKLPENFKIFVDKLFSNKNNERIEIKDIDNDFEEIEFELELNGKRKTFYVVHRNKIQPDIDVSYDIVYDIDGQPTLESLVMQSELLINDVLN